MVKHQGLHQFYRGNRQYFVHHNLQRHTSCYKVIEDTIFDGNGKVIDERITHPHQQAKHNLEHIYSQNRPKSPSIESTEHLLPSKAISATKTELATLLEGSSVQQPASVRVVVLWSYKPKHVTDLAVKKGDRVTLLHRNGELAFVENASKQQGFVPLSYCSLIRRRSSSLTEISSELLRNITRTSGESIHKVKKSYRRYRKTLTPEPGRRQFYTEHSDDLRRANSTEKMPSKGTYHARKYENKRYKKPDKGLFNLAAKKLRKVFTTSTLDKKRTNQRKEGSKQNNITGSMPNWLDVFDYNNTDYSSSSDSSDDEAFETSSRQRSHSSSSPRWELDTNKISRASDWYSCDTRFDRSPGVSQLVSKKHPNFLHPASLDSETSSQEITTGYATVRKLKTASSTLELIKNRHKKVSIVRSSSFSHGDQPRGMSVRLRQSPIDLIEESESDEAFSEGSYQMENTDAVDARDHKRSQDMSILPEARKDENKMIAIRDFLTTDEKDLDVYAGQEVYILNKNDKNWWLVESEDGKGGFVPCDILKPARMAEKSMVIEPRVSSITETAVGSLSTDFIGKDKTGLANVKLARISPTVRESNPLQAEEDEMSFEKKILDLKRAMRAQIIEFEESKLISLNTDELREDANRFTNIYLDTKLPRGGQPDASTTFEANHEPCNIYISSAKEDNSSEPSSRGFDAEKEYPATNDTRLPSYDQLMAKRQDTHEAANLTREINTHDLGPSTTNKLTTTQMNIKPGDTQSSLINSLMTEFKQEQKRIGNEALFSPPRDYNTAETASACDSSSQTSFDSTEPIPRALRRRNSVSKKVRFQTPETVILSEKRDCENDLTSCKDRILATWM